MHHEFHEIKLHFFRILIIIWGVNKITKKLVRPWATSNNELLDFLSRVPDRVELVRFNSNLCNKNFCTAGTLSLDRLIIWLPNSKQLL